MNDEKKSILKLLDEKTIKDSSIPSNYLLGKELFDNNNIEITEFSDEKVTAIVHGVINRKVEFILNENFVNWKCTCRLKQNKYCKHAVAVGLEIIRRK